MPSKKKPISKCLTAVVLLLTSESDDSHAAKSELLVGTEPPRMILRTPETILASFFKLNHARARRSSNIRSNVMSYCKRLDQKARLPDSTCATHNSFSMIKVTESSASPIILRHRFVKCESQGKTFRSGRCATAGHRHSRSREISTDLRRAGVARWSARIPFKRRACRQTESAPHEGKVLSRLCLESTLLLFRW